MTAKEIIDGLNLLENNLTEFDEVTDNGTDYIDVHEVIFEAVRALEQTRWIPCSERLPDAGERVGNVAKYYLVQNEYGDMLVARYTHSEYWERIYQIKRISDKIVAWMPLPTPWEGG